MQSTKEFKSLSSYSQGQGQSQPLPGHRGPEEGQGHDHPYLPHHHLYLSEYPEQTDHSESDLQDQEQSTDLRGHHLELEHMCKICDKCFPTQTRLHRHQKTHLNEEERPYKCEMCDKRFSAKWNLDRHVKESHEGIKRDRPRRKLLSKFKRPEDFHKCHVCDKPFSHRTSLTRHIRSHSDDKPYECDLCDKSFVQASDLDRHRRVHTGERPFQCTQCDRAFTQSANLSRHLKYHETLKAKKIVYGRDMNLLKDTVDYKKLHDLSKERNDEEDSVDDEMADETDTLS